MKSFSEILSNIAHTDKNTEHSYGQYYDYWFAPLRNHPVNVLEIGVCIFGGGGVLALAEYFQQGTIWGIEIDCSRCIPNVSSHPRIKLIEADAFANETISKLHPTTFDLIIDDVKVHNIDDQMNILTLYRPLLKDHGIYIIEDCITTQWVSKIDKIRSMGLRQTIVDMSNSKNGNNTLVRLDIAVPQYDGRIRRARSYQ